ncbi:MAG: glycosyltransferase [Terriglobales bacterium]
MPLRILVLHNRYRTPGGEDTVVATETALLRAYGHEVEEYRESNEHPFRVADLPGILWSLRTIRELRRLLEKFKPHIVHCHNIYYRISPSAHWLCYRLGIPVVQTLHNFRYACVNARLSRDGKPCELCLGERRKRYHGIIRGCFRNSKLQSTGLAFATELHERIGSFSRPVSFFIALSHYARKRHILSGIPEHKIIVKPNCVYPDPGVKNGRGTYCLFAGRLEVDKGVRVLLQAASRLPGVPIIIAGHGPLEQEVRNAARTTTNLQYLGGITRVKVLELMKSARLLLFPTLAYENFPMTIGEAFAVGLPVAASRLGTAAEIVHDSVHGILFEPANAAELAGRIRKIWDDDDTFARMGAAARAAYEHNYSGEAGYRALCDIYRTAILKSGQRA